MSDWTVTMFPEEKAFIDEVFRRTLNNEDGRGDFIAPLRGGTIYLNELSDYTEEQQKWLVFVELHKAKYRHSGVKGMKFMNFTYNNEVPPILEDPEAMDKWGVLRMTTGGQPVDTEITGKPIVQVRHQAEVETMYEWSAEQQQYLKTQEVTLSDYRLAESGWELPEKVLD